MTIDKRKLALILRRMEDQNDGEALAAMRIAGRMLKEAGYTWETAVLGSPINKKGYHSMNSPVAKEPPSFVKPHPGMTIKEQVAFVMERYNSLRMADRMIMTVIKAIVKREQPLSPKNQGVLLDIVHRIMEREGAGSGVH